MVAHPPTQYVTEHNLAARQRLWTQSRREPEFDLFPWVLDLVGVTAGDPRRVLDVGCGNGSYERVLEERRHAGPRVAVDLSAGMLRTVPHAARVLADVEHLPLGSAGFDVVLAPHMLYHVPDVRAAAIELRRVLAPDGVFVAVTNGVRNLGELRQLVETAVGTGWTMARPADRYFSLENGRELLTAGFAEVTRVDCPPSSITVTEVEPLAEYVASLADHYEESAGVPWTTVVDRVRDLAGEAMDRGGELRLTSAVGAFVGR